MRRIIRAVDLHSRKLAARYEITGPQLLCLRQIVARGSLTATELAGVVHLSASTVVGILDRLEEKGWIQRERDRTDRRLVRLTATRAGREHAAGAPSLLHDALMERLQGLPELEQAAIAFSLERVVDLMEAPVLAVPPAPENDV